MNEWRAERIFFHNQKALADYDRLCQRSGIRRDAGLESVTGLRNADGELVAAGGLLGNTLRSLVVSPEYRGEGLLQILISELMEEAAALSRFRLFIYGKSEYRHIFESLGFYPVAEVRGCMVFMENRSGHFEKWLNTIEEESRSAYELQTPEKASGSGKIAALVMHLNPITKGHEALILKAWEENKWVHLFILDEESDGFSARDRGTFARAALEGRPGIIFHGTDQYLISRSSFPSYFLRQEDEAARVQAELDAEIFLKVADRLGIQRRYLGDEPYNSLGRAYNQIHAQLLTEHGLEVKLVARFTDEAGLPYSATRVRKLLSENRPEEALQLVPEHIRPLIRERLSSFTAAETFAET